MEESNIDNKDLSKKDINDTSAADNHVKILEIDTDDPINIEKQVIQISKDEISNKEKFTNNSNKNIKKDNKKDNVKDNDKSKDKNKNKDIKKKKKNLWWLEIGLISFILSACISVVSEVTASAGQLGVIIALLLVLVFISIIFDGIGVATASCDIVPIRSMASKKIYGAKTALWICKHNEKVANICNDVIGDTIGVISGACTAAIVVQLVLVLGERWQQILTIVCSSIVAAITISGKAFLKNIAINKSKEFVMTFAKCIAIFSPEENRRRKAQNQKKKKQKLEEKSEKEKSKQNK